MTRQGVQAQWPSRPLGARSRSARIRSMVGAALLVALANAWATTPPLSPDDQACREAAGFGPSRNAFTHAMLDPLPACERAAAGGHPDVLAWLGRAYGKADRHDDAHRLLLRAHHGGSPDMGKAEELRRTQVDIIRGKSHAGGATPSRPAPPCLWVPFVLSGHWM